MGPSSLGKIVRPRQMKDQDNQDTTTPLPLPPSKQSNIRELKYLPNQQKVMPKFFQILF